MSTHFCKTAKYQISETPVRDCELSYVGEGHKRIFVNFCCEGQQGISRKVSEKRGKKKQTEGK
jgi:hypothetical protein